MYPVRARSKATAPGRSEVRLAVLAAAILAALCTTGDTALLARTYNYFGGGALNRPFALHAKSQYLAFLFESAAYDVVFYCCVFLLLSWVLLMLFGPRLKPVQRLVAAGVGLSGLGFGAMGLRYKLFEYFGDKFSFHALKDLTAGRLTNMFGWISASTFLLFLPVPVLVVLLTLAIHWIGKKKFAIEPFRLGRGAFLFLLGASSCLLANHVLVSPHKELQYGLSNKLSYDVIDKGVRSVWDYDRNPYVERVLDQVAHASAADVAWASTVAPDGRWAPITKTNKKNVFVTVIETFRSDVTEMQLQGEAVMPYFEGLAKQYAATRVAVSDYGITSRAILTVLSGMLHFQSGDTPYLPGQLRRLGYQLHGVSAQDESWGDVRQLVGMDHFASYFDASMRTLDPAQLSAYERINHISVTVDSQDVVTHIFKALDNSPKAPEFFYINFQDLHYPYYEEGLPKHFITEGHKESSFFTPANAAQIKLQYANAANHLDHAFASLVEGLKARNLLEDSVVVIVGDHPDSIYENGLLGHAWSLHPSQRFTPLLVVHGKGHLTAPASQTDVYRLIRDSLDPDSTLPPLTITEDPAKKIFVVAGPLEKPRHLGFLSLHDLAQYDVGANLAQFGSSQGWTVPSRLKPGSAERQTFERLMDEWKAELVLQSKTP